MMKSTALKTKNKNKIEAFFTLNHPIVYRKTSLYSKVSEALKLYVHNQELFTSFFQQCIGWFGFSLYFPL